MKELKGHIPVPGEHLFSVSTGEINPFKKESRQATELMVNSEGFVGVTPIDGRTIFFYDSHNNAKIARNKLISAGGKAGDNIMIFEVAPDGVPVCICKAGERRPHKRGKR